MLFTDNDLDAMKNGKEIKHDVNGEVTYYMSDKQFKLKYDGPSETDWLEAKILIHDTFMRQFLLKYPLDPWTGDEIDKLILLRSLKKRYENGERSKELYDAIMKITKKRYI